MKSLLGLINKPFVRFPNGDILTIGDTYITASEKIYRITEIEKDSYRGLRYYAQGIAGAGSGWCYPESFTCVFIRRIKL